MAADLARLSVDELANLEITSVSLRAEPLSQAASAVYVVTAEDIRRSGAASLPEVLRLAPNLQVQRLNSVDYAISARGFNGFETSNKLLVLIDGRSVYSLLHSGVFWDQTFTPLEDIERIEVISGPGGTLFGANAVNGVINIITKTAGATQGPLALVAVGAEDRTLTLRYGGGLGELGAWRAYVTGFDREGHKLEASEERDGSSGLQADAAFDLLFSDMVMPGAMNGVDLAKAVWRDRPQTPVLLTTGYSEAAALAAEEGLRLLPKPYRIDDLAAELARLARRPAPAPAARTRHEGSAIA